MKIVAYETHGSRSGSLMNASGKMQSASTVAKNDIAPRLVQLSRPLADKEPIILIACYAGKSGAAQQVANVIKHPVFADDTILTIYQPNFIKKIATQTAQFPTGNFIKSQYKKIT